MSGHDRAYRALLRLYPATFRDDYGEEMTRLFREQLRDARASNGRRAVVGLWTHDRAMSSRPRLATTSGRSTQCPSRSRRSILARRSGPTASRSGARVLLGLLPLWVLIIVTLVAPGFMDPLFANPPSVAGLPAGVFIIAVAMTLMLAGVLLLRWSESDLTTVVAFLFFMIPALALIFIGPALILALTYLPAV